MARRRQRASEHWPEDFTERRRLAAQYGIAAAQNALALLEQARILAEVTVVEDTDDELDEDEVGLEEFNDEIIADDEAEDDLQFEMDRGHGAEVFLGDHARARAFALTVFAAEEVAKAYVASLILTFHGDQDPSTWGAFWRVIRGHHRDKLQAALSLEQVLPRLAGTRHDDLSQSLRDVVNEDIFQQRNQALYVDVVEGVIKTPDKFAKDPAVTGLRVAVAKSMVTWAVIIEGSLKRALEELD